MLKALVLLVAGTCATLSVAQSAVPQSGMGNIGASAVWQPVSGFPATAQAACGKSAGSPLEACVIGQMAKAGASADAVRFTRELYKLTGDVGIMSSFNKVGPVTWRG